MTTLTISVPQVGLADTTEDVKVATNFTNLGTWANGNIDTNNIASAAGITTAQLNTTGILLAPNPSGAGIINPSRVVNTAYQPSTTRPTLVTVCAVGGGSGSNTGILKIGATSSPTTVAAGATLTTAAGQVPMTVILPAAWWYEVVVSVGSLTIPQTIEITL